jgi:hypothetical protein
MRVPVMLSTRLLLAASLLAGLALPGGRLRAQAPLVPGMWTVFEWFLGAGPVDGAGFLLEAAQPTRLRVTDDGATGDAFDLFVNGALLAATPSVPGGVLTDAFDGDAAWKAPGLSRAELVLDPGRYTITLAVREVGSGYTFGEGYVRADAVLPAPPTPPQGPSVVPEPATVASLGTGLLFLASAARRRSRRAPSLSA